MTTAVAQVDLLAWLDEPAARRGLRTVDPGGDWAFVAYRDLAALTRRAAAGLLALGVAQDAVVGIVAPGGPTFVAAFFGALAAGCTPAPLPAPSRFQDRASHTRQLGAALRVSRPAAVVADLDALDRVRPLVPSGCPVVDLDTLTAGVPARPAYRPPASCALLQFTSGSTGPARAVRVSRAALTASVRAIGEWLRMTPADATATWLPPYHDMGLVGCLLTPVTHRSEVWLMRPEDFVHRPVRYLECFGRHGATLTATPVFGLDYLVRKVGAERLSGLDFSRWRAVVVGAERIGPATLAAFAALLAPYGFEPRALTPAYGLAEATLAVTGAPPGERWRTVTVDPASLRVGARVRHGTPDRTGSRLVGCGTPVGATEVSIVDSGGRRQPDGVVGEIMIRGPGLADGYLGDATGTATRLTGGTLHTGDAGFLLDGQLYVLGRLGDGVKLRGRMLLAEELEAALHALGVPPRRVAVLLGHIEGQASVVVLVERAHPDWLGRAGPVLGRLAEGARVVLLDAPAGTIARTSSGKPRRRLLWRDFLDGRLPGTVVAAPTTAAPMTTAPTTGGIQ